MEPVDSSPVARTGATVPSDMVAVPRHSSWLFAVAGVEVEGEGGMVVKVESTGAAEFGWIVGGVDGVWVERGWSGHGVCS